jgi:hypothetical protein
MMRKIGDKMIRIGIHMNEVINKNRERAKTPSNMIARAIAIV